MVKTYEIKVLQNNFQEMAQGRQYVILQNQNFSKGDFILFKEEKFLKDANAEGPEGNPIVLAEFEDTSTIESGAYFMSVIEEVVQAEGLKEGYVLLMIKKIL